MANEETVPIIITCMIPEKPLAPLTRLRMIKNEKLPNQVMIDTYKFTCARTPIDLSFRQLENFDEFLVTVTDEEEGSKSAVTGENIIKTTIQDVQQDGLEVSEDEESNNLDKSLSQSLRLNNNSLNNLEKLPMLVYTFFQRPIDLAWLDLSFNMFTFIPQELKTFPNLQILYLHGNKISNISDVDNLKSLHWLKKLTLHGNPLEQLEDYRYHILRRVPYLKEFDFSVVTFGDMMRAQRLKNETPKPRKKP